MQLEVDAYLRRRYEGQIADIEIVDKEDLDLVSFVVCLLGVHSIAQTRCACIAFKQIYCASNRRWITISHR